MCDYELNLIAWIDGELEAKAARQLEQHLQMCASCSRKAEEYREISRVFAVYSAAVPVQKSKSRWRWASVGAGAMTAAAAMILWMLPGPVEPLTLQLSKPAPPPAIAFEISPPVLLAPARIVHRKTFVKSNPIPQPVWNGVEPFVEIAIPADAIFAPGALPAGFTFAAALGIGGDGSPSVLRVQPGIYLK